MKTILINHAIYGVTPLSIIQSSFDFLKANVNYDEFKFIKSTVKALIDKITDQDEIISGKDNEIKYLKEQLEIAELERKED